MKENSVVSELWESNGDSALTMKSQKISELSLVQESLPFLKEMVSTEKLSFYAQKTKMLNLFQKLGYDSILNSESSLRYWNE